MVNAMDSQKGESSVLSYGKRLKEDVWTWTKAEESE